MADNTKQGPKDITDLKARLGLKKPGGGPAMPGAAPSPFPAPPGAAPIPGARPMAAPMPGGMGMPPGAVPPPGAGIPAPPGFPAPVEAPPPQADVRRDPYAAQQAAVAANLAAFYGAGGALPGDGDAVKQEPKGPKPWPVIGAAVGAGLLMFFVGWAIGSISVSRKDYNQTTESASRVRDQVDKIHKQVEKVKEALKEIKLSDREPPNFAAIEKLAEIDFKEPDMTRDLFHTNYFSFEPPVVQSLFNYYSDTTALAKQLADHSTRTIKDRESIEKFTKTTAGKKEGPLGVILDYSGKFPLAQLVEILSPPLCPKPDDDSCTVDERKMRFRTAIGGDGQSRGVKGLPQNIVLAINPTDLQKQVMSGDPAMLAFRDYVRRAAAIFETMRRINETEKQLIEGLKKRATQPQLFAL